MSSKVTGNDWATFGLVACETPLRKFPNVQEKKGNIPGKRCNVRNKANFVDQQQSTNTVEEPLDLIRISLDEQIYVKMRNDRELQGRLHACDQHLNMILGDIEEIVTMIEINEETYEEIYKSTKWNIPMFFVRGDGVVLLAPPLRVG
uniref:U6 snRNA-associated Sm-like protein LSm3 n=1 Tax=Myodes glareolus TaxID=447135 RepID=UPI002022865E|nr:U6 snRNA-associated Sm-like protein LSm3 [Myodes glareolus]